MPYSSKADLPDAVKKMSKHQQEIWMSAFNAAYEHYKGNEEAAFGTAWKAAKKGKKK